MSDVPADRPQLRPVSTASAVALVVLPLAALVLHLAFAHGYGYFRDELYYLACTRHLAWGYVDQPPLSIGLLWIVTHTLGTSLPAIRFHGSNT